MLNGIEYPIGTSVLTDVATDNVRKDEASIDSIREGFQMI